MHEPYHEHTGNNKYGVLCYGGPVVGVVGVAATRAEYLYYGYYAQYEEAENQFVVRFLDPDGTVLYTQKVNPGETVMLPMSPTKDGHVFNGWLPDLKVLKSQQR